MSKHRGSTFNIGGTHPTDSITVANKFCEYFSSVAKQLKSKNHAIKYELLGKPVYAGVVRNNGVTFKFKHVNEKEVYVELKNLKRKKAQGLDDFPPGLLRMLQVSLRNH